MDLPIWFLILVLPGIIALLVAYFSKNNQQVFGVIGGVLVVVGLVLWIVNPAITGVIEEAQIAVDTGVNWEVTCTASDAVVCTVNNDARTITTTVFANITSNALYKRDNSTAFADPTLAFKCRPLSVSAEAKKNDDIYTAKVAITDPGKVCDSGSSYLFSRATGQVKANLPWTADGVTKYETNYVSVAYGSSEYANLTLYFNDAGIANSNALAGDSYTYYMDVCGITYTGSISIVSTCV